MSTTIDLENAKQIREPMEVYCGMTARDTADLTFSAISGAAAQDGNISVSLDTETWAMKPLTDLSGEGWPLDGSCSWYDATAAASEEDGKIGIRSSLGEDVLITVSASRQITAITVEVSSGSGTITANGTTYTIRRIVVIPVNASQITLSVHSSDPDARIEIASITPGIVLEWSNEDLIVCRLSLRSDLTMDAAAWKVSDIEIQAYWPDDITESISNTADNVPIWYYAGYDGDYSDIRHFYLSEPAQMTGNVITLKGQDASYKLDKKNNVAQVLNSTKANGRAALYNRFKKYITDAGIKLISAQTNPPNGTGSDAYTLVFEQMASRQAVAEIMNLARHDMFWPTFVDAGIPKVTWSKPDRSWTIREEDCGDVTRNVDRNIAKILSTGDYGIHPAATRNTKVETVQTKSVTAGKGYSFKASDNFYWYLKVTNASSQTATADRIVWTAKKTTTSKKVNGQTVYSDQCVVKGKEVTIKKSGASVTHPAGRPGITLEVEPDTVGRVYYGDTFLFPNYRTLFNRSNITGSFTWKGDPRMQPRDVFAFERTDGTRELCTVEEIILTHSAGGTSAEISYRKGIC